MRCECCGQPLPDAATVPTCAPCHHALRIKSGDRLVVCSLHDGYVINLPRVPS